MALSGQKIKELRDALTDAFDRASLIMMVKTGLDEDLGKISPDENVTFMAYHLVMWADTEGRLPDLIKAAVDEKPGNEALRAFYVHMRKWLTETSTLLKPVVPHVVPQPREIVFDVLLAYSELDQEQALQVAKNLTGADYRPLLCPGKLFVEQPTDYE